MTPARLACLGFLALGCSSAVTAPPEADPPKKPDPAAVRAEYAKKEVKVLGIAEPVELAETFYWKDGGSSGIVLTDGKKAKHSFSMPAERPYTLHLGATHPSHKGAAAAKAGGPEEQELYGVLLRFANAQMQRDALFDEGKELKEQKGVGGRADLWEFRTFFLRLDERFTKPRP